MEFDNDHPPAIVEHGTFKTRYLKLGDLVLVPSFNGYDGFKTKQHPAVVTAISGHKAELLSGPYGTECWNIRELYWLNGAK